MPGPVIRAQYPWAALVATLLIGCQSKSSDPVVEPSVGGTSSSSNGGTGQAGRGGFTGQGGRGAQGGAGASGAGGGAPLTGDPYQDLVPPLWEPAEIPQRKFDNCRVFVGDVANVPWPTAKWRPGSGYDFFDHPKPESNWLTDGAQGAWTLARHRTGVADELYAYLVHGGRPNPEQSIKFERLIRVRDLETVAVLALTFEDPVKSQCSAGNSRETALDLAVGGKIEPFQARFRPETGAWTFTPKGESFAGSYAFDTDDPWQLFVASPSGMSRLDTDTGSGLLVRENSARRIPASLGDTAIWTEDGELWALRGTGSPQRWLTGLPVWPCSLGITPEWVFGAGEQTVSGGCRDYPTNARVWRAPRGIDGLLSGPLEFGPTLVAQNFAFYARSWGNYAAFGVTLEGHFEVLLLRFSDWRTWKLNRAPDEGFQGEVWGLDASYFYVGESTANLLMDELRRYSLTNIEQWATVIDPGSG